MAPSQGFTLIELLVVIAIIGMLSSIVLGSLNTARLKGRDAAIRAGVQQFATLFELQYSTSGSYASLQPGWVYTEANCNAQFGGSTYAANARQICANIVRNVGGNGAYISNTVSTAQNWSIMVYLPGKNVTLCAGSSGARSDTNAWGIWSGAGCYTNP
jgi:prepilin-type N-terminal cleavage/methylation domain-containing protein